MKKKQVCSEQTTKLQNNKRMKQYRLLVIVLILLITSSVTCMSSYFCHRCLDISVSPAPGSTITTSQTFTFSFNQDITLNHGTISARPTDASYTPTRMRDTFFTTPAEPFYPSCIYLLSGTSTVHRPTAFVRQTTNKKFGLTCSGLTSNTAFRLIISCRCLFVLDTFEIETTTPMYYKTGSGLIPPITRTFDNYCDKWSVVRSDLYLDPIPINTPIYPTMVTTTEHGTVTFRLGFDLADSLDFVSTNFQDQNRNFYDLIVPLNIHANKVDRTQMFRSLSWVQAAKAMTERMSIAEEPDRENYFPVRREDIQFLFDDYSSNPDSVALVIFFQDYKVCGYVFVMAHNHTSLLTFTFW